MLMFPFFTQHLLGFIHLFCISVYNGILLLLLLLFNAHFLLFLYFAQLLLTVHVGQIPYVMVETYRHEHLLLLLLLLLRSYVK